MLRSDEPSRRPGLFGRIRRWFSSSGAEPAPEQGRPPAPVGSSLAARLASDDDSTFVAALTEAVEFGPRGERNGMLAMEEALRLRAGREDLRFRRISPGALRADSYEYLQEAPGRLVDLAREGALLQDPLESQDLISACLLGQGEVGVRECVMTIRDVAPVGQFYTFQLLYNHLLQSAKLAQR